jgi:hypothetical protein
MVLLDFESLVQFGLLKLQVTLVEGIEFLIPFGSLGGNLL